MAIIPKNYARLESGYREKALKIYLWVCGRCSRELVEGKSSESIDPLSQKRCAFVVSSVQGKIDFC